MTDDVDHPGRGDLGGDNHPVGHLRELKIEVIADAACRRTNRRPGLRELLDVSGFTEALGGIQQFIERWAFSFSEARTICENPRMSTKPMNLSEA
jgi:hypothetical protein